MTLMAKYDDFRDMIYRHYERLFPAPVEVRLLEILGATTITIGAVRRNGLPMTLTLSKGRLLRSRRFRNAVLDSYGVMAPDVKFALRIMGSDYERDVIGAYEQDEKLRALGWSLMNIKPRDLWNQPARIRSQLMPFLAV